MILITKFLSEILNVLLYFQENWVKILIQLDNFIILGLIIIFLIGIILFSGKVKKSLEIGSQIATIIGTAIAAKAYSETKTSSSNNSNPNSNSKSDSNSNSNSNSKSDSNSDKKSYLYPFLAFINKNLRKKMFDNKYKSSIILPFLGIILPENATDINNFAYSVLSLSIIILWTLTNVLGYLSAIHLLSISNFEIKYPKLFYFFKYFRYSSLIFVLIQGFICIIAVITLIIVSYYYIQ